MASVLRSSNLQARQGFTPYVVRPPATPAGQARGRENECLGFRVARALAAEQRIVAANHEIYAEGEQAGDVYVVLEGWAVLYQILEDGRRQILDFALPGAVLGFAGAAEAEMRHSAEALTDLKVAVLPRGRLGELFVREPRLAMRFVEAMAGVLESAYESLTDAGRRTAREAVAHFLLRLARRYQACPGRPAGAAVDLPLTLEHIGDALGLTAVHVCRTLRGLREDGIVVFHKGRLRIQSAARLATAAGAVTEDVGVPLRLAHQAARV
jgi:CRP-like cAMP-binding protein